jgi:H+/Cl- antiporter ClcA
MRRIREIFRTQYIGAIVVGMLVTQALTGIVSLLVQPVIWYQQYHESRSVMQSGLPPFPWSKLLPLGLTVVLYVLVSYLMYTWIYAKKKELDEATSSEDEHPPEARS